MGFGALVRDAAQQQDGLADHELGHAARVGERRVEDRDTATRRGIQVHLVGANAKAAHCDEAARCFEDAGVELAPRADAEHMDVTNGFEELFSRQCLRKARDVLVASASEVLYC